MRCSTAVISAALLTLNNNASPADAFGLLVARPTAQRRHRSRRTTTTTTTTRLPMAVDPSLASSAIAGLSSSSSSSYPFLVATSELADVLGSLALLSSVGFGVFSGIRDPDWRYEYKVGNDAFAGGSVSDVALLEVSPISVAEKIEESMSVAVEPEPAVVVVVAATATATEAPVAEAVKPPPIVPEPAKASAPSEGILKSAEKAKEVVQKKGVQETKERMNSRGSSSSSPAEPKDTETTTSTEVVVTSKTKDGRGRIAKGVTLIVAAGIVALVRNVVKAYLGRGML